MVDIIYPIIVLLLIVIVVIQAFERHSALAQAADEKAKLIAALIAKTATDYTDALKAEKHIRVPKLPEATEINLADASQEDFLKHIEAENED